MNPMFGKVLKAVVVYALKGMATAVCNEAIDRGIRATDKAWANRKKRDKPRRTAAPNYASDVSRIGVPTASAALAERASQVVGRDRKEDELIAIEALGNMEDMDLENRFPENALCDANEAFSMVRRYQDDPDATVTFKSATSDDISTTDQLEISVYVKGDLKETTQLDSTNLERE